MRIHHLTCGTMHPIGFGKRHMICHCLLVETPKDGLMLVDSGFGVRDLENPKARVGMAFSGMLGLVRDSAQAAVAQVQALGFAREDVRHIVLTHMDVDHVGGLVDFPAARVHVHAVEHAAAQARQGFTARQRYLPAMWEHGPDFHMYADTGEPWNGFQAVRALDGLPPEILMIPLAGHTRGHCAVAVEDERGWLLHAGDAYFDYGEVHLPQRKCPALLRAFQSIMEVDRKARLGNQARLRALAAASPDVTVFSAHDPRELPSVGSGGGRST